MEYRGIEIEGQRGSYAQLRRKPGSEVIEVELLTPTLNRTHYVRADDPEDQWSMAECLQETLEGRRGTGLDIRTYFSVIEHLAD